MPNIQYTISNTHYPKKDMNSFYTIALLIASNVFMTLAWYGHLKMAEFSWFKTLPLIGVIALSWGIAFFEYCLQVPANRIGFEGNGGPFSLMQLKILQEVITLVVFVVFSVVAFHMQVKWNHIAAALCLVAAVYFVFGFK
jgi:uncharacterized protein (DUF486 family)